MWGLIGTWRMALEGIQSASTYLDATDNVEEAVVSAIQAVEDYPYYKSVGYGGLPNQNGDVELDAGFMDGDTLAIGGVAGIKDFKNPIAIAYALTKEPANNLLVDRGAEHYGTMHHFERRTMLSDRAQIHYENRLAELTKKQLLVPYAGHDTVGITGTNRRGHVVAGTSTSGLFMKHPGRVGDSPVFGAGLYADSDWGGATITGMGEDVMKGALSYEVVRRMQHQSPQAAVESALADFNRRFEKRGQKLRDVSIVAMNPAGDWGVATNIRDFSCVVATAMQDATVYVVNATRSGMQIEPASEAWLAQYMAERQSPLKRYRNEE
ncbi:MAG: isoaspartyl peptidase/L-asparaginase [Aerococcus sp.]|nr:isoaspartyl peptidase/L-asparaginase [Aerococcus sp.]